MTLGFCLLCGILMGLLVIGIGAMVFDLMDEILGIIICIAGALMLIFGVIGCGAYALGSEKVENTIHVPVCTTSNNIQIIEYNDVDTGLPVIVNVNEAFKKIFVEGECISVTIYSEGPYNGIYMRPKETIDVCEDPMCQPPTFIPPPLKRKHRNKMGYQIIWDTP